VARDIVSAGDKVLVCPTVDGNGRRQMLILDSRGSSGRRRLTYTPFKAAAAVTEWLESQAGPGQNAVGGKLDPALLDPRNTTTSWDLPTDVESGTLNTGLRPLGLARFKAPLRDWTTGDASVGAAVDVFVTCWPRNDAGDTGLCLGAWRVSDQVNLWIAQDGLTSGGWTNPDYPLPARFFADKLNGWIHGLPSPTSTSPGTIFSAAAQDLYNTSSISRAASGGLNLANVSLHSFTVTLEDLTTEIQSYLCCPAHPATSAGGQATVDFLKMDQSTGAWSSQSTFDAAYLVDGGPTAFSDTLAFGSETGGPCPWRGNQAVLAVSGGILNVLDSTQWEQAHLCVRTVNPSDGSAGDILLSKTYVAVSNPDLLPEAGTYMKAQVLAATHDLSYSTSFPWSAGYWLGGVQAGGETKSEWAHFKNTTCILLPAAGPNLKRLDTLENALAVNPDTGARNWPTDLRNEGGGIIVERNSAGEDTTWLCALVPKQKLIGGGYSHASGPDDLTGSEPTIQTYSYLFSEDNDCTGVSFSQSGFSQNTIVPYGSMPDVPADSGIYTESVACVDIGYPDLPDQLRVRNYSTHDEGEHTQIVNIWEQRLAIEWETWLFGIRFDGTVVEKNISRTLGSTYVKTIGTGGGAIGDAPTTTVTVIETLPVGNNVQKPMAFDDKGLVLLLRDLHADGAGANPTPHLEILNSGGDLSVLSTVRLGSYSELQPSDNLTLGWKAGDQLWDPYAFGPPRMKGCLDAASGNPFVLVMVGEQKKVDPATDSQFKRVCYALIDLTNPSSPDVTRVALTSPDEGVGSSGNVPTDWPLWWEWDTLILTAQHVAWIKDSKFRESNS